MEKPTTDGFVQPDTPASPSAPDPMLHASVDTSPPPTDPIQPSTGEYNTPVPYKRPSHSSLKGFFSLVQLIVGAFLLAFVINRVVFQPYEVFGHSMMPTLSEGDRLIINKLGKSFASVRNQDYIPKRGEIIVFHNPNNENIQLVKRVVGLPGERVVVRDGELSVYTADQPNGFNYDDFFGLDLLPTVGEVDLVVPDGEIFVVGDNRGQGGSLDSRNELGTVPFDEIVGNLTFRIFPLSEATSF